METLAGKQAPIVMATLNKEPENERVRLANIYTETNHDARFESMRKNTRSARVLRRHEDLRKQCEKEVRTYERWQKLAAAELRQSQGLYLDRLRRFKKTLARPGYHSSHSSLTSMSPSPREVSSANSVPHYLRCRRERSPRPTENGERSPRPTDNGERSPRPTENELPAIDGLDTNRSYSSIGTVNHLEPTSDGIQSLYGKSMSRPEVNYDDVRVPSQGSKSKSTLSVSFPGMEFTLERTQFEPLRSHRSREQNHVRVSVLSPSPSPRSTTSLPSLTSPRATSSGVHGRSRIGPQTARDYDQPKDFGPRSGELLFSVKKVNGEETYIRNKKKTVTFIM